MNRLVVSEQADSRTWSCVPMWLMLLALASSTAWGQPVGSLQLKVESAQAEALLGVQVVVLADGAKSPSVSAHQVDRVYHHVLTLGSYSIVVGAPGHFPALKRVTLSPSVCTKTISVRLVPLERSRLNFGAEWRDATITPASLNGVANRWLRYAPSVISSVLFQKPSGDDSGHFFHESPLGSKPSYMVSRPSYPAVLLDGGELAASGPASHLSLRGAKGCPSRLFWLRANQKAKGSEGRFTLDTSKVGSPHDVSWLVAPGRYEVLARGALDTVVIADVTVNTSDVMTDVPVALCDPLPVDRREFFIRVPYRQLRHLRAWAVSEARLEPAEVLSLSEVGSGVQVTLAGDSAARANELVLWEGGKWLAITGDDSKGMAASIIQPQPAVLLRGSLLYSWSKVPSRGDLQGRCGDGPITLPFRIKKDRTFVASWPKGCDLEGVVSGDIGAKLKGLRNLKLDHDLGRILLSVQRASDLQILDETGAPLSFVQVSLEKEANGERLVGGRTDENGNVRIPGILKNVVVLVEDGRFPPFRSEALTINPDRGGHTIVVPSPGQIEVDIETSVESDGLEVLGMDLKYIETGERRTFLFEAIPLLVTDVSSGRWVARPLLQVAGRSFLGRSATDVVVEPNLTSVASLVLRDVLATGYVERSGSRLKGGGVLTVEEAELEPGSRRSTVVVNDQGQFSVPLSGAGSYVATVTSSSGWEASVPFEYSFEDEIVISVPDLGIRGNLAQSHIGDIRYVSARKQVEDLSRVAERRTLSASVDPEGNFEFVGISPGRWQIYSVGESSSTRPRVVEFAETDATVEIQLFAVLNRAMQIVLQRTDEEPVTGARCHVPYSVALRGLLSGATDASGVVHLKLPGWMNGTANMACQLQHGALAAQVDLTLPLQTVLVETPHSEEQRELDLDERPRLADSIWLLDRLTGRFLSVEMLQRTQDRPGWSGSLPAGDWSVIEIHSLDGWESLLNGETSASWREISSIQLREPAMVSLRLRQKKNQ